MCVVGGGYTGLWTALAVKEREPSARVVVLEAVTCGSGPSGRNGGFVHGYWASLAELVPLLGRDSALELARAAERIVPAVRALGADEVWLRESGMLMVSASSAQDTAVEHAVSAAADAGSGGRSRPLPRRDPGKRLVPEPPSPFSHRHPLALAIVSEDDVLAVDVSDAILR